jgi:hypothetical protein
MSDVGTNATTTGSSVKTFGTTMVFILVLVALYYLYQYLYGASGSLSSTTLLSNLTSTTTKSTLDPNSVAVVNLAGVSQGGQYSLNMWVYVASAKSNNSELVHLLDITGGTQGAKVGNTLLFLGLDPTNGTLVVRQSSDDDTQISTSSSASSPNYTLSSIMKGYISQTNTPSSFHKDDRCDIINGVEYQRWVLITVVASGRTLDVYLDGKLARSCVYKGMNNLGVTSGNAVVTIGKQPTPAIPTPQMTGYFSTTNYYNYALTPDLIWGIYQGGPSTSQSNFFTDLFSTNINFGTTSGLNK